VRNYCRAVPATLVQEYFGLDYTVCQGTEHATRIMKGTIVLALTQ
jgi:hypothetical protein